MEPCCTSPVISNVPSSPPNPSITVRKRYDLIIWYIPWLMFLLRRTWQICCHEAQLNAFLIHAFQSIYISTHLCGDYLVCGVVVLWNTIIKFLRNAQTRAIHERFLNLMIRFYFPTFTSLFRCPAWIFLKVAFLPSFALFSFTFYIFYPNTNGYEPPVLR